MKLSLEQAGLDNTGTRPVTAQLQQMIDTIAAAISEERDTIEDVYEPYLIQIGFIARTPRGRMVLPPAYDHLGYEYQTKFI